jgi:hypothetical protein
LGRPLVAQRGKVREVFLPLAGGEPAGEVHVIQEDQVQDGQHDDLRDLTAEGDR